MTAPLDPVCLACQRMSTNDKAPSPSPSPRDVLRDMWAARRGEALADLEALVVSLEALAGSPRNAEWRTLAQQRAHQLVGAFGVFGFADLKSLMAHIDIDLSDPEADVGELLERTRDIISALP